jgi:hypothetical protein
MDKTKAMLITGFFVILSEHADIAEAVIRSTVTKHDLGITREDVTEVRAAFYPSPEWLPAELELYRILGI